MLGLSSTKLKDVSQNSQRTTAEPYEKPISGFSSPVKVTTQAIGGSHGPQTEGLSGQDLCFLGRQGQVVWCFSYESAQAAPDVKAA